jgi:hypothetical protein
MRQVKLTQEKRRAGIAASFKNKQSLYCYKRAYRMEKLIENMGLRVQRLKRAAFVHAVYKHR